MKIYLKILCKSLHHFENKLNFSIHIKVCIEKFYKSKIVVNN